MFSDLFGGFVLLKLGDGGLEVVHQFVLLLEEFFVLLVLGDQLRTVL